MYSVWVAWKSALEGGEIIEWCLSTNKWHTLCLSRLTCPLLFGSQHIQLLNVSQLLGDKHRTCCSQWLHACIFTRGLVGLGFLSRLSPEWVKGETARREPHIKIFFQKKKKISFLLHTSSAYLCTGLLVLGVREPCITKPLSAKLLPGWHLSFINWFCYSVLWVESYIPAFKTKRCWSPNPQSLSVEGTYPHYLRIWPYWEIGLGQMW